MKTITITEYQACTRGIPATGCVALPPETFDALRQFALTPKCEDGSELMKYLGISSRSGVGEVITAKNYVGVIQLKCGVQIEILPKIASACEADVRELLVLMLGHLKNTPKISGYAGLDVRKCTLLDIFIRMFVDEVLRLQKQEFRSAYIEHQGNESFFKGKLLLTEHVKLNHCHHERFFVQYDIFSINHPINRLIKATLDLLLKTQDGKNKTDIRFLLGCMDAVTSSRNYDADFSRIVVDRNMMEFASLVQWCRVFLNNESFTPVSGSNVAYALLFEMNILFENYVTYRMRQVLGNSVKLQDSTYHLFTHPQKRFSLRPDIVVFEGEDSFVLDTKWKLLSGKYSLNYGISHADMYQMYAYHQKYHPRHVTLLYPATDEFPQDTCLPSYFSEEKLGDTTTRIEVRVRFVDLLMRSDEWKRYIKSLFL